ncbi:MAG: hypothetical protein U1E65_20035 [Myxococcota bacterium]
MKLISFFTIVVALAGCGGSSPEGSGDAGAHDQGSSDASAPDAPAELADAGAVDVGEAIPDAGDGVPDAGPGCPKRWRRAPGSEVDEVQVDTAAGQLLLHYPPCTTNCIRPVGIEATLAGDFRMTIRFPAFNPASSFPNLTIEGSGAQGGFTNASLSAHAVTGFSFGNGRSSSHSTGVLWPQNSGLNLERQGEVVTASVSAGATVETGYSNVGAAPLTVALTLSGASAEGIDVAIDTIELAGGMDETFDCDSIE